MTLDLSSLQQAVKSLGAAVFEGTSRQFMDALTSQQRDVVRAGVVQNFEFTYELCWKFMRRYLRENLGHAQVDGIPRRELFRLAAENRLLDDVEPWFLYHKARNVTAHTYNADTAGEVFQAAVRFLADAEHLLQSLEQRNG
jgi:nucleotidyltransferase substrate binding protein (TIGR01987 family)